MKYCTTCGNEVMDEAVICPKCGCEIIGKKHSFCHHCGAEVNPDAVICVKCGCTVQHKQIEDKKNVLSDFCNRLKINGIIWLAVAGVQLLLSIFSEWFLIFVCALNIVSGILDITNSQKLLKEPIEIIKKVEPLAGPIIMLVYNVIFGGIVGVAGSIYYLAAVRGFAITNKQDLLSIEAEYNEKHI